jgi:hypothetical protein
VCSQIVYLLTYLLTYCYMIINLLAQEPVFKINCTEIIKLFVCYDKSCEYCIFLITESVR